MATIRVLALGAILVPAGLLAQVEPVPPLLAPEGPVVLVSDYALDGLGGVLRGLRIGVALGMAGRIGALAPGYEADIIALDGDPLVDLTAVRRVVFVMRGGGVYKWAGSPRGD